jgi:hypothetical protein
MRVPYLAHIAVYAVASVPPGWAGSAGTNLEQVESTFLDIVVPASFEELRSGDDERRAALPKRDEL